MKLFSSNTSPFVRKVRVLLHEAGLFDQVSEEFVGGSPLDPARLPVSDNPLGKIPTLILADGQALYDSRVICGYLSDLAWPEAYPKGALRWRTLTLESTADGILEAALLIVYEYRLRPEAFQFQAWVDGQWSKVDRSLSRIEAGWMDHLEGPVCMGQLALAVALGYLDFRHAARDWRSNHPKLAPWFEAISQRPSMVATIPFD